VRNCGQVVVLKLQSDWQNIIVITFFQWCALTLLWKFCILQVLLAYYLT